MTVMLNRMFWLCVLLTALSGIVMAQETDNRVDVIDVGVLPTNRVLHQADADPDGPDHRYQLEAESGDVLTLMVLFDRLDETPSLELAELLNNPQQRLELTVLDATGAPMSVTNNGLLFLESGVSVASRHQVALSGAAPFQLLVPVLDRYTLSVYSAARSGGVVEISSTMEFPVYALDADGDWLQIDSIDRVEPMQVIALGDDGSSVLVVMPEGHIGWVRDLTGIAELNVLPVIPLADDSANGSLVVAATPEATPQAAAPAVTPEATAPADSAQPTVPPPQATPEAIISGDCTVSATRTINQRGGPGTTFDAVALLGSGNRIPVSGQTLGANNYTWWQLENGNWVREDVVFEEGDCESVPQIEP